jgi:hypothetical protein
MGPLAKGFSPSGENQSPPRPKAIAKVEGNKRRRRIIIRPVIIKRPVISAIGVAPVMPDAAARTEVGCFRRIRFLHRSLQWRRSSSIDRGWAAEHQAERQYGCADPSSHERLLISLIHRGGVQQSPASKASRTKNRPAMRACVISRAQGRAHQRRQCRRCQRRCQRPHRTSVVICFEPSWTAVAAAGLLSDSAWARSAGAARTSNAPTAASPRTFVTFIYFLPWVIGITPAPCGRSNQPYRADRKLE